MVILTVVVAFRFAWRPDTKVFPYEVFPDPSFIDNGDNGGGYIPEKIKPAPVADEPSQCVPVLIGNGACNHVNNRAECKWDGGDCCRKTCNVNCDKRKDFTYGDLPCKFECGSFFGY